MKEPTSNPIAIRLFFVLGSTLMILVVLYFGKPVLLPISLSVLLAFILNPLVKSLELLRLGRILSVLIASGLAFATIGLASWAIASQVQSLANDLPNHQQNIRRKIDAFKTSDDSTYGRLSTMFEELLTRERLLSGPPTEADPEGENSVEEAGQKPEPVFVVRSPSAGPDSLDTASAILMPIVQPLGTAALVVVLVIFLLIRREDVRYRAISLMGDSALTGTTRLMRDAAQRVSKYLLSLLGVNAAFGVWFGFGLYCLGVPYAPLWGFLTLCFRFIPFVGSPASVLFPLLISVASATGWSQPIWVLTFFGISELVTANFIEPVLFGKTTGLTPIALLIAVLFWTWVWGPIGLLLSTPLTVCLVVLGQHIPQLRSLKVLLAEQPTLDAKLQYFHRLLASDEVEGKRVFINYANEMGRGNAFDDVIVPALQWTRRERERKSISPEEEDFIWMTTRNTIKPDPAAQPIASELGDSSKQSETALDQRLNVFCHPVHHVSEEIALTMLREMIETDCDVFLSNTNKLPSKVLSQIESARPDVVVLGAVPPGGIPQIKFLCREICSRSPDTITIVAYLAKVDDYDHLLVKLKEEGASYLTTSLGQTKNQIRMVHEGEPADEHVNRSSLTTEATSEARDEVLHAK